MAIRFDLTDLRLFVNVVRTGTLTAGAQASHLTLSSASGRILAMEDSLGAPLLLRKPRGVVPTPAGHALAQHATVMLLHAERMRGELGDYARGLKGQVRVLCNTVAMQEYLPGVLGTFLAEQPQINVVAEERMGDDIVTALAEGSADIGVFSDEIKTYELETYVFSRHRLVLVTPVGHALAQAAGTRAVSILEADACDVIGLREGSALQERWEARAARRGIRLNYRVRVPSFEAQCRLIESGAGVALLPEATARRLAATMRLAVVPLSDAWMARKLLACVRKRAELPPGAQKLLAHITQAQDRGAKSQAPKTASSGATRP